jgi:hypothetical protein
MKVREPVYSAEVEELLEQREIDVDCWQCTSQVRLTLLWVSTHRDMCCPECGTLIILNTSKLQGEVARLRRQLGALHSQMSGVLNDAPKIVRRMPRQVDIKPQFKLALAKSHPDKLSGCVSAVSGSRRSR